MASRFNALKSDSTWQRIWEERRTFAADDHSPKPRSYVLEMFPYPSGRIHMGHVRNYTMGDVLARYRRMIGHEVLHPMGWDAFGMPAENAAMEQGGHPRDWTYGNIATMRDQLKPLGLSIDWSREFATCDDDYVAQQQALFLDFLDAGKHDQLLAQQRLEMVHVAHHDANIEIKLAKHELDHLHLGDQHCGFLKHVQRLAAMLGQLDPDQNDNVETELLAVELDGLAADNAFLCQPADAPGTG